MENPLPLLFLVSLFLALPVPLAVEIVRTTRGRGSSRKG